MIIFKLKSTSEMLSINFKYRTFFSGSYMNTGSKYNTFLCCDNTDNNVKK